MVWNIESFKPEVSYRSKAFTLARDFWLQDVIEGTDPIGCNNQNQIGLLRVFALVEISYLAAVKMFPTGDNFSHLTQPLSPLYRGGSAIPRALSWLLLCKRAFWLA